MERRRRTVVRKRTRGLPKELSRVNLNMNAAGIDVGASSHRRALVGLTNSALTEYDSDVTTFEPVRPT